MLERNQQQLLPSKSPQIRSGMGMFKNNIVETMIEPRGLQEQRREGPHPPFGGPQANFQGKVLPALSLNRRLRGQQRQQGKVRGKKQQENKGWSVCAGELQAVCFCWCLKDEKSAK